MKSDWASAFSILMFLSLVAAGCSSASPTPTKAPVVPTNAAENATPTTAAPPAAPKSAATAVKSGSPAAVSSPTADWQVEWEKTVAAAKREGKVVIFGLVGESPRAAAMEFQKAYPDIQVEFIGGSTGQYAPQLLAERRAGQYLLDVFTGGAGSVYAGLLPGGAFDPLKPALLLPEVLDDSKWVGGFDDGWGDKEHKYVYMFTSFLEFSVSVNRDFVPESELNSLDQLLEPKWKGKIVTRDPRVPGPTNGRLMPLLIAKGEDWQRKFLAQDLVIVSEYRQQMDAVVRGQTPIGIGIDRATLEEYRKQGLALNVVPLAPDEPGGAGLSSSTGSVELVNRAPHPNAARVFINWLLTKAAQESFVRIVGENSRRIDVEGSADIAPRPGVKYPSTPKEEAQVYSARTLALSREILK